MTYSCLITDCTDGIRFQEDNNYIGIDNAEKVLEDGASLETCKRSCLKYVSLWFISYSNFNFYIIIHGVFHFSTLQLLLFCSLI